MASRREERERLRQARLEREQEQAGAQKRKTMLAYVSAGIVGLAVLVGIVVVIAGSGGSGGSSDGAHINLESGSTNGVPVDDREGTEPPTVEVSNLKEAAKQAGCTLRLGLSEEGRTHLPPDSPTPKYKTNPPTSGNHVDPPYQQADGAYSEMPDEIFIVHSLEHGRVEIQYSPDLPETDQLALKGVYDSMYGGALMFPNPDMPYEVAVTAWTSLLGCPTYKGAATLDAVRAFSKATWGKYAPEPANAFPITGPTPAQQ